MKTSTYNIVNEIIFLTFINNSKVTPSEFLLFCQLCSWNVPLSAFLSNEIDRPARLHTNVGEHACQSPLFVILTGLHQCLQSTIFVSTINIITLAVHSMSLHHSILTFKVKLKGSKSTRITYPLLLSRIDPFFHFGGSNSACIHIDGDCCQKI